MLISIAYVTALIGLAFLEHVEERADLVGVGCGADRLAGLGENLHHGGVGVAARTAPARPWGRGPGR